MNLLRLFPLTCLLVAGATQAQSIGECPLLPIDSDLTWQKLNGSDFTFCKAIRGSDDAEIFAVTIAEDSPFDPRRSNRVEKTIIDGHEGHWYRGEIASAPGMEVRETLIELDNGRVAHISMRAASESELANALKQAEALRFRPTAQLSSN